MFKVVYERRFGKRSMFEIGVPLVTTNAFLDSNRRAGRHRGRGQACDLYARLHTADRVARPGVSLPTGDRFKDHGAGAVLFEPFISAGTMFRDWYVQTQLKVELSTNTLREGHHVVYNTYLGRDTSAAPNTWTIGVELNGEDDSWR